MFVQVNTRKTRVYTCALLDMVEQGVVDRDSLIRDLLAYMSDAEVEDFARSNGYVDDDQDE